MRVLTPVLALALLEKITDGQNFLLDFALAGQTISGDKPRETQEKPGTQGQRIDCSLTCVGENNVLIGAYIRYQAVYGGGVLDLGEFLIGRREMKWKGPLMHNC